MFKRSAIILSVLMGMWGLGVGGLHGADGDGGGHAHGSAPHGAAADRSDAPQAQAELPAPLFDGLGDYHRPITTDQPMAQRYFDQGLILVYGFGHEEAIRQFEAAAEVDPNSAMAYWGIALAYGPNINAWPPLNEEHARAAYEAIQKAKTLNSGASEKERALIEAMATRHAPEPQEDRSDLDRAYMQAMRDVMQRYPDDPDVAVLFVDAVMNTTPWDYWTKDGEAKPEAAEAIEVAERVMRRHPDHPGANHLYIHLVEAGPKPETGEAAADRLADLVPDAGHLVHMPSHIYIRIGRYADAMTANERAIAADESYIAQCRAQGFYPLAYYPHNIHFLWYAAMMAGDSDTALDAATKIRNQLDDDMPESQRLRPTVLFTLVRFGQWDRITELDQPPAEQPYALAMWHHGQGLASLRTGRMEAAEKHAAALQTIVNNDETMNELEQPYFYGGRQAQIANHLLQGELAGARDQHEKMVEHMRRAVDIQDSLPYMEPPYWYYPTRHSLGAALLEAGRPAEAEAVYRKNLDKHPRNGWALHGLMQSLQAQDRTEEARDVQREFDAAWQSADTPLTGSRF